MVYQIYFGEKRGTHRILFDMDVYLHNVESGAHKGEWYSEIHVCTFAAGIANFIWSDVTPMDAATKIKFLEDCDEIDDLRGWLFERTPDYNTCLPLKEARERFYGEGGVVEHVKKVVYDFAKKYNCHVNED